MSRTISLWRPKGTVTSDEACTTIHKYVLAGPYIPGPYEKYDPISPDRTFTYVPSLQYFCLNRLLEYPDQVHTLGPAQLHYDRPVSPGEHDVLRELIPQLSHDDPHFEDVLKTIDPRLWAVLIQLLSPLPPSLRVYTLPLSDVHLPLLQEIPSRPSFALVTVLELRGNRELDDQNIVELRALHGLGALDVGGTAVSSWGIKNLSKTLQADEEGKLKGPWGLRVLYLRDCMNVQDDVFPSISKFPLISVVDVRGTRCKPNAASKTPFRPCKNTGLYHPTPLISVLSKLSNVPLAHDTAEPERPSLFAHPDPFFLRVSGLHHTRSEVSDARQGRNNKAHLLKTFQSKYEPDRRATTPDDRPFAPVSSSKVNASGSVPDLSISIAEQNVLAAEEVKRHASRHALASFYATTPKSNSSSGGTHHPKTSGHQVRRSLPTFDGADKPRLDPLILFRHPPPWTTLEGAGKTVHVIRTVKRARSEDMLHGDEARRSKKAKEALWTVQHMLDRRRSSEGNQHRVTQAVAVTKNPFVRKPQSTTRVPQMDPSLRAAGLADANGRRVPTSIEEDVEEHGAPKSNFPIPPRTTKPLKPISTLPVPPLPPAVKPGSKRPLSAGSGTRTIGKQTTLPTFAGRTSERTPKRAIGEVVQIVGGNVRGGAKQDCSKVKRRSSFDWKGWSGG